ncbi:probable 28S ribosomal protein S16, mitochondrial [Adelges cooleyi]|uniref:probable 28S ribosomal protein S16, mitochondrial n=1 Tax=Adelges cooleyi TaxID=133065 RepID=UPI00217FD22A|nr:probable 28S ribosomal protein S16, mitochondrial [Adelges cooleyi]XP_050430695.1 probable 28S ribosomal protein S16, mitochondrial [Adelges cooleyi]XP_050430697.1 probable 28S ribosomal protein S16, mitochondrial [Adelges cooleyi]XP_050430698.1 probable 28S ribosomal protein S16, mitochondrial [Adelges cooleyi]
MRAYRIIRKLVPSSGGGDDYEKAKKSIRLARHGCANRPFFHIVVVLQRRDCKSHPIEQLGTYDPLENHNGEKMVSLNLERIKYWMAKKTRLTDPVAELLGLSGFLPMHPRTYMTAWRNRQQNKSQTEQTVESASP